MTDICNIEDDPSLTYIVVVPDTVHLGKTYKCCWGIGFVFLAKVTGALLQPLECFEATMTVQ